MKPNVRVVPITQLLLDDKNANKGTRRGRELLEESLGKYGAGRSVLVDREGRIIAGNKTVETARAAGMKNIAVIETDGETLVAVQRRDVALNSKKGRELAIADNRVAEIGLEWNPDVELRGILGEKPLEAPAPKLDKAAELQRKWRTKRYQQKPASDDSLSCLENPRPEGAESSLTENVTSPFPAEPRQNDTGVLHDAANLRKWRVNSQTPMVTGSLRSLLDFLVCGRRYPRNVELREFEVTA